MQLHQIKQIHKNKKAKIRGRGGKKGTYSGHGIKGQNARAGRRLKPIIRDILKRYPKLKGHRALNHSGLTVGINLNLIEKSYHKGETVNELTLIQKKVFDLPRDKDYELKILGKGAISKPLVFENCKYTKSALAKIKKAKGTIK